MPSLPPLSFPLADTNSLTTRGNTPYLIRRLYEGLTTVSPWSMAMEVDADCTDPFVGFPESQCGLAVFNAGLNRAHFTAMLSKSA